MLYELYEKRIKSGLSLFPEELCFMLSGEEVSSEPAKLLDVLQWVKEFPAIKRCIIHISTETPESITIPFEEMAKLSAVRVSTAEKDISAGCGTPEVLIVIGRCGRQEICKAVADIAASGISPDAVTEDTIEEHLLYQVTPDFVIKTGGNHLTDFLIWQSVYSELFFTDVNWDKFRYVDFLRALRDFQSRQRRFGK